MRTRPPLSYLTAYLQFTIAIVFILGFYGMVALLIFGVARIPDNLLELVKTLAIALTNALGLLFAFLFLRSRVDGTDPATTTTKTESVTTPNPPIETPPEVK